ncbi:hypothetical protein BDW75DRAFT_237559 [Aspergillus navahoensis]
MAQPMGLFVSRIQDLEQCKSCLGSRNLGAADYYMYVGLPLPPRATFVPKFQDMINWAWNQEIVSDRICECGDVERKAIRKRRLELAPEVLIFQIERTVQNKKSLRAFKLEDEFEIPSSVLPEGQNPIKEIGTRRWAFLDDDESPATYNNLWKLVSSKQQSDPSAFQVYAVIAEKDKGEKKKPSSMPVSEKNIAGFLPLHTFELDVQIQARHAELGWLSGRARKRKLEQEPAETQRELHNPKRQKTAEQAPATQQTNNTNGTTNGANASTTEHGTDNTTSNTTVNTTSNATNNTTRNGIDNATNNSTSNGADNTTNNGPSKGTNNKTSGEKQ